MASQIRGGSDIGKMTFSGRSKKKIAKQARNAMITGSYRTAFFRLIT
jgi:hypothetical protein